ncbi:MAG: 5'/3'-nucleotidase SurE [Bacillota bacterium]|jgi:5'-nucleotidase
MRILLTNDDGIHARGLDALRLALEDIAEVIVAAPDRERSATGHGITVDYPIRVSKYQFSHSSTPGWIIDGTPADCVKLAICALLSHPPDLVVSGINRGGNLGTDVLYSGTVSAAIEGIIQGIPSIAVSLNSFDFQADYSYAASVACKLCLEIKKVGLTTDTMLNVNVPAVTEAEIKGTQITKLGIRRYEDVFQERQDPRGRTYFWLAGDIVDDDQDQDADVMVIRKNIISITPIHFDLTNFKLIQELKDKLNHVLW